jgi:ribosomal protein L11 methyltransferase
MLKETWIEVRFLMPAGMQEEGAMFLTEFSGRGVILEEEGAPAGGVVIRAFFRPEEFGPWQQEQLQDYLKRLAGHGLYPLGLEMRRVAEEDWAEAWKAHFKPLKVTDRLVIRPPWEDYAPAAGELVLTIYPGMAFGTGRHPTTLLCLRALEEVWGPGLPQLADPWQVLDVGTGTGILALAALALGAERVVAVEYNELAVRTAARNLKHNHRDNEVLLIQGDARRFAYPPADLALINIHLDVLLDLLDIPEFLDKKWYIFSGILGTQMARFGARLAASPLQLLDTWSENLWFTVLAQKH